MITLPETTHKNSRLLHIKHLKTLIIQSFFFKIPDVDHGPSFKIIFINNPCKRMSTELSKHVWKLNNINFRIIWKILKQATAYNPSSKLNGAIYVCWGTYSSSGLISLLILQPSP